MRNPPLFKWRHFEGDIIVLECTGNEFRPKVVRDEGLWVQGILRPW